MTLYKVIGTFKFRGHLPGETFFARIDPEDEARYIGRNIEVLERLPFTLDPARIRRPKG